MNQTAGSMRLQHNRDPGYIGMLNSKMTRVGYF